MDAARELLLVEGFGRLTIDAVAARSGVSKPTIYRSWANASELAMAALVSPQTPSLAGDHGDARSRLTAQMRGLIGAFATTRGRQVAMTLASADPESEYTRAFRNRIILESRDAGRIILQEAIGADGCDGAIDLETLLDMIYGPIFFRLLVAHAPLTAAFGDMLVDLAFRALATGRDAGK